MVVLWAAYLAALTVIVRAVSMVYWKVIELDHHLAGH